MKKIIFVICSIIICASATNIIWVSPIIYNRMNTDLYMGACFAIIIWVVLVAEALFPRKGKNHKEKTKEEK